MDESSQKFNIPDEARQSIESAIERKEQQERKEVLSSTDYWYARVIKNLNPELSNEYLESKMTELLKNEIPDMLSVIMERQCNLQCTHCLFQNENESSKQQSLAHDLPQIIERIVDQMPKKSDPPHYESSKFLHEGRTLRNWHLDILKNIREKRPDMQIGLIDNGSYISYLKHFKERGLKLDWLDISIDGTENSHNLQRDPEKKKAYNIALRGLKHAREITIPQGEGGRVSSLYTLTKLNYKDIEEAADFLFSSNPEPSAYDTETGKQMNFIDELHLTTMAPQLEQNFAIEISLDEFAESWEQIKTVFQKNNREREQRQAVSFRIYRHQDLEKLASVVGNEKFLNSITNAEEVDCDIGRITFYLDGVPVTFSPLSTWPQETFNIDADGAYRPAFCQKYKIEELQKGVATNGVDTKNYTFQQLDASISYIDAYKQGVDSWWENFGKQFLVNEIETIKRIKKSG